MIITGLVGLHLECVNCHRYIIKRVDPRTDPQMKHAGPFAPVVYWWRRSLCGRCCLVYGRRKEGTHE